MVNADTWMDEVSKTSGITTEQLDKLALEYQKAYDEYEKSKRETSNLYKEQERLEGKLREAMELAGKSKYFVETVGTFYFSDKYVVTTPKTIEEKRDLLAYIREKHGEDFFYATVGVNHQTLQKLYKTDLEAAQEAGESPELFHIPGLQQPTLMRSLNLRGEKK